MARPERPAFSNTTPAPLLQTTSRPRSAVWAANGWSGGTLLLTFATITLLLARNLFARRLAELLRERDASISETAVNSASSRLVLVLVAALAIVTLLVGLTLRTFLQRRRGARILMIPVIFIVLVVTALVELIVPTSGWQGWALLGTLVLAVLSLLFGLAAALTSGTKAWLQEVQQ